MTEIIKTEVVSPDDEILELEFQKKGDVVTVVLNGEEVCSGDWTANFYKVFLKAIRQWDIEEDE